MPLATAPGAQSTQQLLEVDPISLDPPAEALDFQTTGVDDEALDAVRHEEARQPKCVIANLVAKYDQWWRTADLGPAIARGDQLGQQGRGVPALNGINARLVSIRKLDSKKPGVLAHLQCALESVGGDRRGVGCSLHFFNSFSQSQRTKESD